MSRKSYKDKNSSVLNENTIGAEKEEMDFETFDADEKNVAEPKNPVYRQVINITAAYISIQDEYGNSSIITGHFNVQIGDNIDINNLSIYQ